MTTLNGDLTVGGTLRVEGWLQAPNLHHPCRGYFTDAEALRRAWPMPLPGWWALVGATYAQSTVWTAVACDLLPEASWQDSGTPAPETVVERVIETYGESPVAVVDDYDSDHDYDYDYDHDYDYDYGHDYDYDSDYDSDHDYDYDYDSDHDYDYDYDHDHPDLRISDPQGNPLVEFAGGHIRTKNFDSSAIQTDLPVEIADYDSDYDYDHPDLGISDPQGNVLVEFAEGHIRTASFDSSEALTAEAVEAQLPVTAEDCADDVDLEIADEEGRVVLRVCDGHISTARFDSASFDGSAASGVWAGKRLSVIGDSISTYRGVSNGDAWYPDARYDLAVRSRMWWQVVADTLGMEILKVAAGCSTLVSGLSTDSNGNAGCSTGRIKSLAEWSGDSVTTAPDAVVVYMGINDFNMDVQVGSVGHTEAETGEGDITVFAQAYLKMVLRIMRTYPAARVYCCTLVDRHKLPGSLNPDNSWPVVNAAGAVVSDYNAAIAEVCRLTGAVCVDVHSCGVNYHNMALYSINTDGLHPNAAGHRKMAETIVNAMTKN